MTLHVHDGKCEVWCPSQNAEWTRSSIAAELGIGERNVTVHTTFMGGGFGRRFTADFQTEAAQIAKHVSTPLQLVWTREDDMTHDFYRGSPEMRQDASDAQGNVEMDRSCIAARRSATTGAHRANTSRMEASCRADLFIQFRGCG